MATTQTKLKAKAKSNLTRKQKDVLDWIKQFFANQEIFPTYEEIGKEFSISVGNVFRFINILEEKGYIERDATKAPAIQKVL